MATLAEIAHRLGRVVLEDVAATAKPDPILGWYRKLITNKFDRIRSGAAGAIHDYGGVGKLEGLPLSAARPRCEVLPILSRTDQNGKCESLRLPARSPNLELVRGTPGEVGQRTWPRLILFGESLLRRALQQYMEHYHEERKPSGQRQWDFVFFAPRGRGGGAVRCRDRLGGLQEALREGSGVRVDGTAGDGLTISTYIKDAGNLLWQKTSRPDLSATCAEQ
jgi:hypothetical protein